MRRSILFIGLALIAPALSPPAWGHPTGELTGVVEDPSGYPIPGAKVKLTRKAPPGQFNAVSDEAGGFKFSGLPEGDYFVSSEAPGMEATVQKVKVGPGTASPVRLRMAIADAREEITVKSGPVSSPMEEINPASVRMDLDELQDLPSMDADPLAVPSLFTDPVAAGTGGPKVIMDGVETDATDIPVLSIRRVRVNRNPYSAEFGRPGRGRIEVQTRRGSFSRYRGNFLTLLRNSAMDARNAFAAEKPLQQRWQSEAAVGGPLGNRAAIILSGRYDSYNQSTVINALTPQGRRVENFVSPDRTFRFLARLDLNVTPTSRLTVGYKYKNKSDRGQDVGGFDLPERATDFFDHENIFDIAHNAAPFPNFLNELRVSWKQGRENTGGVTDQPAIVVLDAFRSGGAQVATRLDETRGILQDAATLVKGRHTFRFGGGLRLRFFEAVDTSNFGGTFTFSSLSDFEQNHPFVFSQNSGHPQVNYSQHEFYGFFQDEFKWRPDLLLLLGSRYEGQSNGGSLRNFAPRLGAAYAPGHGKTVYRAGLGVFYELQPEMMERQSLLVDGERITQIVISEPGFPQPFLPGMTVTSLTPSVVRIAPDIRFPYLVQGSLAVERQLGKGRNYLSIEYTTARGVRLYRRRNLNAPLPGTGLRPEPDFININQFESSGTSRSNGLTIMWKSRLWKRLRLLSQYTISRTTGDTGETFPLPADNYNLLPERGRADFDRRHRFSLAGTFQLPRDFRVGTIVDLSSGIPFNTTTGFDDNHDTVANDRPPGVTRNTGRGPGYATLDLRLAKVLRLGEGTNERRKLEFALDAFNFFNRVNYKDFVGTLTSPFYGRANAAFPARQLQLSMRYSF